MILYLFNQFWYLYTPNSYIVLDFLNLFPKACSFILDLSVHNMFKNSSPDLSIANATSTPCFKLEARPQDQRSSLLGR